MTDETCNCRNSFDSLQSYLRYHRYHHPDRPFNYDWKNLTDISEEERWYFRTAKSCPCRYAYESFNYFLT